MSARSVRNRPLRPPPSMRIDTYLFEVEELGKSALDHLKALKIFGFAKATTHKAIIQSRPAQHAGKFPGYF
ncbi:MAG: hypothetical protein OCC49_19440 [Fibrobacterales bacterium]